MHLLSQAQLNANKSVNMANYGTEYLKSLEMGYYLMNIF
jgi:hypothetical protein